MIRVLHVVTYMGRGGLETMLMNYYRNIDRTNVQFDFLVHRDFEADYDKEILALGGKIYHMSRLVPWSRSYKRNLTQFLLKHSEYKIVHVHQDCLSSVVLKCAEKAGIPVRIAHSHNANQDKNIKYPIKLFYKRLIPQYATDLFACGEDAGNWMFSGASFTILNNAIPADEYRYNSGTRKRMRSELGITDSFVVGLVARFSEQKNHEFLLEVFEELYRKNKDSVLLLVGDGDLKDKIQHKAEQKGISDHVLFLGVRSDVPDLLQAVDVFVMPSNYEGLTLSAIEAQAAGLPCVISNYIPIEVKKTNLVHQLHLNRTPEDWADYILRFQYHIRSDTYDQIKEAGYDVESNARWLQKYYLEKAGKEE